MDAPSTESTTTTYDVITTNETITTEAPSHEDLTNYQKIGSKMSSLLSTPFFFVICLVVLVYVLDA